MIGFYFWRSPGPEFLIHSSAYKDWIENSRGMLQVYWTLYEKKVHFDIAS